MRGPLGRPNRLRVLMAAITFAACCASFHPANHRRVAAQENESSPRPTDQTDVGNPFPKRLDVPGFPADSTWLNTSGPIRFSDLRGKFVLLDFWTYCCINCIHVLPELKKLEKEFGNQLVVIGVHSAKFETEKESENIEQAILRYEIEHPVLNDSNHRVWRTFGVQSWPTILLIDPEGKAVYMRGGETTFEEMAPILRAGIEHYRKKKVLDERPVRFDLLAHRQKTSSLRYPGKVLVDAASERIFISDSNHNRIVVTKIDGTFIESIGSGQIGSADGKFSLATFKHPQGMALWNSKLFVADTENHLIRMIDLETKNVSTIAGTGKQTRNPWPGWNGKPGGNRRVWRGDARKTDIASPWALWVHKDQLYIAMAGPHQIWSMQLKGKSIGPYAGNGREDIVDGPRLPTKPYAFGAASFAQPSGLTSDGQFLYVADSEGSSIRAVPLNPRLDVRTVIGTQKLTTGRLFVFGDVDGNATDARLQHPLGVAYHDGTIYVADTYNNKIKAVDATSGAVSTLVGDKEPGNSDNPARFDEPSGLWYADGKLYVADTNNHAIRVVDLKSKQVNTLVLSGVNPPEAISVPETTTPNAKKTRLNRQIVKAIDGHIETTIKVDLPNEFKINDQAPMRYAITAGTTNELLKSQKLTKIDPPKSEFNVSIPVTGEGETEFELLLQVYYCRQGGEGICKMEELVWIVPVDVSNEASSQTIEITGSVK